MEQREDEVSFIWWPPGQSRRQSHLAGREREGGRDLRKWCQVVTVGNLVGSQLEMNQSTVVILVFLECTSPAWLEWKLKVAYTDGLK